MAVFGPVRSHKCVCVEGTVRTSGSTIGTVGTKFAKVLGVGAEVARTHDGLLAIFADAVAGGAARVRTHRLCVHSGSGQCKKRDYGKRRRTHGHHASFRQRELEGGRARDGGGRKAGLVYPIRKEGRG